MVLGRIHPENRPLTSDPHASMAKLGFGHFTPDPL